MLTFIIIKLLKCNYIKSPQTHTLYNQISEVFTIFLFSNGFSIFITVLSCIQGMFKAAKYL